MGEGVGLEIEVELRPEPLGHVLTRQLLQGHYLSFAHVCLLLISCPSVLSSRGGYARQSAMPLSTTSCRAGLVVATTSWTVSTSSVGFTGFPSKSVTTTSAC